MPIITIGTTPISFPDSGTSPNWAQPTIDFAQAVATALNGILSPTDIPPTTLVLDVTYNPISNANLPGCQFSTSLVRAAIVRYSVFRATSISANTAVEEGQLFLAYNPNGTAGSLWDLSREYVGDGLITFTITDVGQVQFTTTTIAGTGHTGKIVFAASTLTQ